MIANGSDNIRCDLELQTFKIINKFDMKQETNILARFKQWILSIVMRSKMCIIYVLARRKIKNRDKELMDSIKTIYPVAMECKVTIKEMIALLAYCA